MKQSQILGVNKPLNPQHIFMSAELLETTPPGTYPEYSKQSEEEVWYIKMQRCIYSLERINFTQLY